MTAYLRTGFLVATFALAVPCAAWPQGSFTADAPAATVAGYFGVYFDNAFHRSVSFQRPGFLLGVRAAAAVHPRLRIVGDLGFAEVDGVGMIGGTTTDYYVYGRESILLTAGVNTSLPSRALVAEVRVGAAWLRIDEDGRVGQPPEEFDAYFGGFTPHPIVTAGVGWRLPLALPVEFELRVDDTVFVDDAFWSHSPSARVLIRWP